MSDSEELIWTPEMVARFWAHEAKTPENYFGFQVGMAVVRHVRHHLAGLQRIADYGAGTGFLIEDLLASGYRCGAVEFGQPAVAALNRKFKSQPGFLGAWEVDKAAAQGERFDAVFLMEVVEHLYDAELNTCLANIKSLLVPGGLLIVTTPNSEDLSRSMVASPESGRLFHRWQHVRSWTKDSLALALSAQGYKSIEMGITDFAFSPAAHRRIYRLPLRVVRACAKRVLAMFNRDRQPPHLYIVAKLG